MDFILLIIVAYVLVFLSFFIQVILHGLGALIFGLINNFEFFSFGIGNYGFLKEDGKIKLKKYKFAGMSGYCAMVPPKQTSDQTGYFWYLSGGIILNITLSIISIILIILIPLGELTYFFFVGFSGIGIFIGISGMLPIKASLGTVGCRILSIYKNKKAYECFYNSEMIWIELFKGTRMKNIPKEMFILPNDANLNNIIFAEIKKFEADKYYDNMEYEKAEETYKSLLSDDIKLAKFHKNEVLCQLLYFEIIKGNKEEVDKLMTKELKKYIKRTYSNISKKRLMYAYTVLIEKNVLKSEGIWYEFHKSCEKNLIKSEIEPESEMMEYIGKLGIEKGIL